MSRRRDAEYQEDRACRRAEGADRRLHGAAAHRVPGPLRVGDHRAPAVPAGRGCQLLGHQEHPDAPRPRADGCGRARIPVRRPQRGRVRPRGSGCRGEECDDGREEVPRAGPEGRVRGGPSAQRRRGQVAGRPRIPRGHALEARGSDEGRDVARGRRVPGDAGAIPFSAGGVQGEAARRAGCRGATRGRGARGRGRTGGGGRTRSRRPRPRRRARRDRSAEAPGRRGAGGRAERRRIERRSTERRTDRREGEE